MRHTHVESNKTQVRFVLAGFTEDGTVAAARYLVNRQSYLYDIYKRFKDERVNKTGDFVAIITGPAHTTDLWGDPPLIAFSKAPNTSLPSQPEPKSSWSKVTSAAGRLIDRVLGKETDSREL
jgi:hypothetical protein